MFLIVVSAGQAGRSLVETAILYFLLYAMAAFQGNYIVWSGMVSSELRDSIRMKKKTIQKLLKPPIFKEIGGFTSPGGDIGFAAKLFKHGLRLYPMIFSSDSLTDRFLLSPKALT